MVAPRFPFPAIVGQEQARLALLLNVINPAIGGVLLVGQKGTAKSTMVRALEGLRPGLRVVTLPLNATEDRIVGTLHLRAALKEGRCVFEPGLLAEADGHLLYIDEVNLLSESLAAVVLDAAASGVNVVEREGVSHRHAARFTLVGSMNPEEGDLKPQLLDRFGLCVLIEAEVDLEQRKQIVQRRLAFEADPLGFAASWASEEAQLRQQIAVACRILPEVDLSSLAVEGIARIALEARAAGHRADLVLAEAARALAAWRGLVQVTLDEIRDVAPLVLMHRRREEVPPAPPPPPPPPVAEQAAQEQASAEGERSEPIQPQEMETPPLPPELDQGSGTPPPDEVFEVGRLLRVEGLLPALCDQRSRRKGSGRRSKTRTHTRSGRYVRYRLPKGRARDIALDATIRAAAPWQALRSRNGLAIAIHSQDLRIKVRERRVGNTILFLVDASGSMGAQRRMAAAKGAILSLLQDAYQKRDTVGLIAFRQQRADLLLSPTRSVDLASRLLRELPTGGRTPLSLGLRQALELIKALRARDRDVLPLLVLISDGRANVPLYAGEAVEESRRMAQQAVIERIPCVIVDTETGPVRLGLARILAERMEGLYVQLDDLEAQSLAEVVRASL